MFYALRGLHKCMALIEDNQGSNNRYTAQDTLAEVFLDWS